MLRSICIATLIATGATAFAEEGVKPDAPKAHGMGMLEKYDTNKDGSLSKDEIAAITDEKAKAHVLALDTNKDGVVDADEIKAGRHKKSGEAAAAGDAPKGDDQK